MQRSDVDKMREEAYREGWRAARKGVAFNLRALANPDRLGAYEDPEIRHLLSGLADDIEAARL